MKQQKDYNITRVLYSLLRRLPPRYQKLFWILLGGILITTCVEAVALGSIAFFVSAVSDPEAAVQSSIVKHLQGFFHFDFLTNKEGLLIFLCILVVCLVAAKNLLAGIVTYCNARYSVYARSYLGEKILNGFMHLPYEWHLSQNSADLVMAVMWRQFFTGLISVSLQGLSAILIVAVMVTAFIIVEPLVSLLVILVVGGSAITIFFTIRIRLDRTTTLAKEYAQSINRDVTMGIHGIKDVKSCGREDFITYKYNRRAYAEARIQAWQEILSQSPRWILETLGFMTLALMTYFMYFHMEAPVSKITGTMALLAVTAWRVLPAVSSILGTMASARRVIPYVQNGLDYLKEIENHRETISSCKRKSDKILTFRDSIRFENVSFAYRGIENCALKKVNLIIKKGKTTGIVGVSGAGKSTLVDLILGLLAPTKGRILIDEQVRDNFIAAAWIRMIGYVQQSTYICDGTLAENVAFGLDGDGIDRNRVLECCRMAAMEDFLSELPNGIDTPIGERGVKLSGGQRQRVSISRALYNSPEIIIFDEATSSLDTKTEKAIQQTMYSFKGKQTLIIIAHRLSTVEDCDEIIWLEKGKIVKTGVPDQLLREYKAN